MNRKLLAEAAMIANILDKAIINNNFTFETESTASEDDYSRRTDALFMVDRETRETVKIWEQTYDG